MKQWKRILKVMGSPSSELYEMKYYHLWPLGPSIIILLCWYAVEILSSYGTNFKFNYRNLTEINILYTLGATIGLYLLFTVVNWAVTTLMNGKGKLREIFCACSYALIPYVVAKACCVGLSHLITMEEGSFITIIEAFALLYSVFLFMSVMMTIHDYTFSKAIFSVLLSAAGIVFVLFLLVLFFGLLQQVTLFGQTIYMELQLRR